MRKVKTRIAKGSELRLIKMVSRLKTVSKGSPLIAVETAIMTRLRLKELPWVTS